jgi:hypothetical protein
MLPHASEATQRKARMQAEGGMMKEKPDSNYHAFIIHPSSFILAFTRRRPAQCRCIFAPPIQALEFCN